VDFSLGPFPRRPSVSAKQDQDANVDAPLAIISSGVAESSSTRLHTRYDLIRDRSIQAHIAKSVHLLDHRIGVLLL